MEVGRTAFYSERWQKVSGIMQHVTGWHLEAATPRTFPTGRHFGFHHMDQGATITAEDSWVDQFSVYCSGAKSLFQAYDDSHKQQWFANNQIINPFLPVKIVCDLGTFETRVGSCYGAQPEWFYSRALFNLGAAGLYWIQCKHFYESRLEDDIGIHRYKTLVCHNPGKIYVVNPTDLFVTGNGAYAGLYSIITTPMFLPVVGRVSLLEMSYVWLSLQGGFPCGWLDTVPIPFLWDPGTL